MRNGVRSGFPVLLVLTALVFAGCGGNGDTPPAGGKGGVPEVYTTFYPTTWITERIAGDLVEVVCPVPEGEDPIFWIPDAETVVGFQEADLVILNGAGYEKWVQKVSLPSSRVVDTAESFEADFLEIEQPLTHSHGTAGEHSHEGVDGHTWLDPLLAKKQAAVIRTALVKLLPGHGKEISENHLRLVEALDALHEKFLALFAEYDGQPILASHPAYNYLAKRYALKVVSLDLDPDEMPEDETFEEIGRIVTKTGAKHILWEAFPMQGLADRLEVDFGLVSLEFSPCELLSEERREAGEDYLSVMEGNLEALKVIFE